MGFLDGLGDVLGGWNAVRRIDKEGFDWREKAAQDEFLRQRQQELAGQQNEDRAVGQLTDYLATQEGEQPDLTGIPAEVLGANKDWRVKQAMGKLPERKSAIAAAKAYSDYTRDMLKGDQRIEQIQLSGAQQQELARLRGSLAEGRRLSPAEQAKLDAYERVAGQNRAAADRRFESGLAYRTPPGRMVTSFDAETGQNVQQFKRPEEYQQGQSFPAPLPATMLQAGGMAEGAKANIAKMVQLADEVTAGPIIGHLSKAWQKAMGPSGPEGEFDFLSNALVDTVYIKSGKQINQTEQGILRAMIPDRARGNLPEQVRLFKQYSKYLLQKYGRYEGEFDDETPRATPRPSPARPNPAGTPERMVKYKGKVVPLSSLPPELQAMVK